MSRGDAERPSKILDIVINNKGIIRDVQFSVYLVFSDLSKNSL